MPPITKPFGRKITIGIKRIIGNHSEYQIDLSFELVLIIRSFHFYVGISFDFSDY